ncbi:MAG: radical SAM protein [Candidatus Hydrogenedentes bacterium]|nr:radical SAM protein [Candidatus Hydrogenedentota bacterium]
MADVDSKTKLVVREVACKTILNRSSIDDYSLNCYTGCSHGCAYCYARYMQRFHPHEEPWGAFVDVKTNAVEALDRQLRSARPGEVFVSSACDGWQPIEKERRLTRACCQRLLDCGFRLNVLTKNSLVLRDFDIFDGRPVRVGVTVTTPSDTLRALWEPKADSVENRWDVVRRAHQSGLETSVMLGPLLPFLSDDQRSIEVLLERAGDAGVDVIWFDALNPRPKVWESVHALLQHQFPDLAERYRSVLFAPVVRKAYCEGLHNRVVRIARRLGLGQRLAGCD